MMVFEITQRAYSRTGGGKVGFKFRCTSGPRKGQVRASPASCNAPINIKARNTLKQTRRAKASQTAVKSKITKRSGATSKRVAALNKPRQRSRKI